MVNQAIRDLVKDRFGPEAWARVAQRAGLEDDVFISTEPYPDSLTFGIVVAASQETGLPVEALLREFGRYWVAVTAMRTYGDMMRSGGRTLEEFLFNLPNFHNRIGLLFPRLAPPSFAVRREAPGVVRVEYRSTRQGLTAFVEGLLEGLGTQFATPVKITLLERAPTSDCDTFLLELAA